MTTMETFGETLDTEVVATGSRVANRGDVKPLSTITAKDTETRLEVMRAILNSEGVSESLGFDIDLANVIIQPVDMKDDRTEEMREVPRVTLIAKDGKAYHSISAPLERDVRALLGVMGSPASWSVPVVVSVTREGKGSSAYFKLNVK